ncbi:MAG: DUF2961 domain-containing protein [Candidatus Poribacteria bacterium]|nr:DUF2961 domain-containing protein [Candidatus Poribacteria bacterium]
MLFTPESLSQLRRLKSRSITHENRTGAPGVGGQALEGRKGSPAYGPLKAGETFEMANIEGPGMIRHIWITIPPGDPLRNRNLIVRMYWDEQRYPSVEAPITDFFGMAHGRQKHFESVLTLMPEGRGLSCYYPMPFKKARITVENDSEQDVSMLFYQVDYTLGDDIDGEVGRFHAQFRRQNPTVLKDDYVLLETEGHGHFIGCVVGVRSMREGWWGEGEVKFFIDDDGEFPTICGTGSEDYACTAWGMREHQTIYHGANYVHADLISYYRWHVQDPIFFDERLKVTVQQIGWNKDGLFERQDDYSSCVFWYQTLPSPQFPALPDRSARSANIELRDSEKPEKRADA